MSNSPLVNYTMISPNKTKNRKHAIDRITPHVYVGQVSVERAGDGFAKAERLASCNYAIGSDGRIALIVDEKDRSWCSSNQSNDDRAVTIECASDSADPYAVNSKVYSKLVDLCADICKRNGKKKLLWFADKDKSLKYTPKSDEMIITVHRWFANKACPGEYLYSRMGDIASRVNAILNPPKPSPKAPQTKSSKFKVKVIVSSLNIRKGTGILNKKVGVVKKDEVYTIVEVKGNWGKLKSGAGYINISSKYCKRV